MSAAHSAARDEKKNDNLQKNQILVLCDFWVEGEGGRGEGDPLLAHCNFLMVVFFPKSSLRLSVEAISTCCSWSAKSGKI